MRTIIQHALTMLLCCVSMVFLAACGTGGGSSSGSSTNSQNTLAGSGPSSNDNSQNPLLGTWVSTGYRLTFKSDNTYSVDFTHDGLPEAWGSIDLSGNVIIVTDSDGSFSCKQRATGEVVSGCYTYSIHGNTLTFSLFHDACSGRAAFLELTYTKQ